MIYIIGSLGNPKVEEVADRLREAGLSVFDQWRAAKGDFWADYAIRRKLPFKEAIKLDFVETAFQFDMKYLKACTAAVLVMPAGRSGGIELGWVLGQGKPGYILYDGEPERPDLMAKLATGIFFDIESLINELKLIPKQPRSIFLRHGLGCSCELCKKNPYINADQEREERRESSANQLSKILPPNVWICPTCGEYSSIGFCSCSERIPGNR